MLGHSDSYSTSRYYAGWIGAFFQFTTLLLAVLVGYYGSLTSFFIIAIPSAALLFMCVQFCVSACPSLSVSHSLALSLTHSLTH